MRFNTIQEFYEFIDRFVNDLKQNGFSEASRRLHEILHEMAWTTSSEVLGEIQIVLLELKRKEGGRLAQSTLADILLGLETIDEYWSRANGR
jgi:hypothetical protein